jgi:hypothetical protein
VLVPVSRTIGSGKVFMSIKVAEKAAAKYYMMVKDYYTW